MAEAFSDIMLTFKRIRAKFIAGWVSLRVFGSFIRLKPFVGETPEVRSMERYRRIALTSLAGMGAKGIAVLTSLISVPLTLHYLGTERYGLWMTASSLIAALAFADLGMGNGLVNAIARAHGLNDNSTARKAISSALLMLAGIAAGLLVLFVAIYPLIPWAKLYGLQTSVAMAEAGPATAVLVVIFLLSMPLGIVQRVQIGYQQGFQSSAWIACGSIAGLIGVLLAIRCQAGLPWLVFAMAGGPFFVSILNWGVVFYGSWRNLRPQLALFDWNEARSLAGTGFSFFILQLFAVIGNASDNIIITQVVGVSAVASYAVTQKLFMSAQVAQYFIAPLWPAFGEAMARQDFEWARRTLNRALIWSGLLGLLTATVLCGFGSVILTMWVGAAMVPPFSQLLGFGFWVLLAGYGGVMSSFLNQGNLLRAQVVFYGIASVVAVILKVVFAREWSATGVIWATVIGYGLFYVIPAARLANRHLQKVSHQNI